jgi:hypothetical protein
VSDLELKLEPESKLYFGSSSNQKFRLFGAPAPLGNAEGKDKTEACLVWVLRTPAGCEVTRVLENGKEEAAFCSLTLIRAVEGVYDSHHVE